MPSFAQSIRDYRAGTCSNDELLARLDDVLAAGRSEPQALLGLVESQHERQPLPAALFQTICARIGEHMNLSGGVGGAEPMDDDEATRLATELAAGGDAPDPDDDDENERTRIALEADPGEAMVSGAKHGAGTVLKDRFVLEELVGQGGMSLVYRALDKRKLEARSRTPQVAVKILDVSTKNEGAAFMAMQREAQKSQTLTHPNIVRVFDFDRDDETVFVTMEYLEGTALSNTVRRLNKQGMELPRAMHLIRQMGEALSHAHGHGIVHADFKPGNVILTGDDEIKVIDFGIARAYQRPDDSDSDKTLFDPRALGALTPAYASPEMLENLEPDPRDDIYSLGCVAYELITGNHPFSKSRATDVRDAGVRAKRPDNLNRRQWRALNQALSFERDTRTPNVETFLRDLLPTGGSWLPWAGGAIAATLVAAGIGAWVLQTRDAPDGSPGATRTQTEPALKPETQPRTAETPAAQVAPSRYEPGSSISDCAACPTLRVIPAGRLRLGSPASETHRRDAEGPTFEVAFPRAFAIGEREVTVGEFRAYVQATNVELNGCRTPESRWQVDAQRNWRSPGYAQTNAHPVTCVSWSDAQGYVEWLSREQGVAYALPTEAQWEYAARAESLAATHWEQPGSACRHANLADSRALAAYPGLSAAACNDGYTHAAPVASKRPNAFELFDTQGNVFEWTADCWNPNLRGAAVDGGARTNGDCGARVLRGGSWYTAPSEVRLAYRNRALASYRSNTFGFRVARELP